MAGVILQVEKYGVAGIGFWMLGTIFPIIILFFLFFFKMLGAGDIKLFSVIGGICGIRFLCAVIIVSFLAGAVLSVVKMFQWKQTQIRFLYFLKYVTEVLETRKRIPYYQPERDGTKCVIRFSVAIGIAVCICVIDIWIHGR